MFRFPTPVCLVLVTLLAAAGVWARTALARDILAGPVAARVLRAVDGDTLQVRATVWLHVEIEVAVRIRGIDAPELHARCAAEREMALAATARLTEAVETGIIELSNIEDDKYGGRIVADVTTDDGASIAELMLASGLARSYDGGGRGAWCGVISSGG
jgi:micrococcal nuclease